MYWSTRTALVAACALLSAAVIFAGLRVGDEMSERNCLDRAQLQNPVASHWVPAKLGAPGHFTFSNLAPLRNKLADC
jgi:hypothetical protein